MKGRQAGIPWPMRSRPIVDLKGERLRDAYPELWRFVTRRPPKSRPWRDFWKVFLPSATLILVGLAFVETVYSPGGMAVLVGGVLLTIAIGHAFRRLGVIAPPDDVPRAD